MLRAPLESRNVSPAGVAIARPSTIGHHVCHVIGNQTVGACQELFLGATGAKPNQAIGRCYCYGAGLRVRPDSIHAEDMFVFHVQNGARIALAANPARDRNSPPKVGHLCLLPELRCFGR